MSEKSKKVKSAKAKDSTQPKPAEPQPKKSFLGLCREWGDALVIAYVLAMFIRTFVVELFKIPSASMTPTLIGGAVLETDFDGDGEKDLVLKPDPSPPDEYHVFFRKNGKFVENRKIWNAALISVLNHRFKIQNDRIFVNKMAYWFTPPKRGDVVVFKIPRVIWDPLRPIYIKRVVGLPGETVEVRDQRLWINGQRVTEPPFFGDHMYTHDLQTRPPFSATKIPEDGVYCFGDNTLSSLDSRYWGKVPLGNLRGRAFFRYSPLNKMKFIK
ncbi:MAG: signal peptidase I [bacterium]